MRWRRPTGLFRNRDGWLSPAKRIAILRQAAAIMQQRREELALQAAREGGKPLTDSLVEVDRAIDGVGLCAEHLRAQAGSEIPMNRNAASAGRAGLHAIRADRRGVGLQRVQPSAEHDRSPGGPGRGGRLSGDREAGGGGAAELPAVRADSCARPACPRRGANRSW